MSTYVFPWFDIKIKGWYFEQLKHNKLIFFLAGYQFLATFSSLLSWNILVCWDLYMWLSSFDRSLDHRANAEDPFFSYIMCVTTGLHSFEFLLDRLLPNTTEPSHFTHSGRGRREFVHFSRKWIHYSTSWICI